MIKQQIQALFILISFLGLISCGGSGGGGSPTERPASTLEGFAVDAQIVGGTVTAFSYQDGEKGEILGTAITGDKGFYTISLSAPDQYILIEIRDGSYIEEASGESVTLSPGQILRAVSFYQSGAPLSLMVTPFTNIAAGLVDYSLKQGLPIETAVTEAGSAISAMAGIDILKIVPANITDLANADTQFTPELKYGFMAAAISSWTAEASALNGSDVHAIWNSITFAQAMYRDISEDGKLNGKGIDPDTKKVVDLGLGLVLLNANTYRAELAKHFMLMVGSEANKVGITFVQAVPEADRLGAMTHPMFGGLPPVAFDTQGPIMTPLEAEGLFHNGVFNFSIRVSDMVGVKSVVFDINGEEIGQGADPENPSFPINTALYADGEYQVGVRALDHLNNETYQRFRVNFVNTGSAINVLSPRLVNRSPIQLSGTYLDNGTGVQSIVVDGVTADLDIENRTWSVEIPLIDSGGAANFTKDIPLVITDGLGVENNELVTLAMDAIPPSFDPAPLYSDATFISGATIFSDKLSFAETSGIPIRIETDNITLNGTPILGGPLASAGIPYIELHVKDLSVNGIFTPKDEITAELQYSLAGTVLTPWRTLAPVITGNNDYRFIAPLVSESLHDDWHLAMPSEEHRIQVRIKDRAGNTADFNFQFKVEFVPPEPIIISKAVSPFNAAFAGRRALFGQVLPVSEYTFTNHTGFSMLFSLSDTSTHTMKNTVEQMIRIHTSIRDRYHQHQIWNGSQYVISNEWFSFTDFTSNGQPVYSDTLPPDRAGQGWQPHSASDNLPNVKWRDIWRYRSVVAPHNENAFFEENASFGTSYFEVVNGSGIPRFPSNGYYAIPALTTYTIKKIAQVPILTTYNDTQIGDPANFREYTTKRYDKVLQWTINNQVQVQLVHDAGAARVPEMVPRSTTKGVGISIFTLGR